MSRKERAVHYLLEHRLALMLAGFLLLVDQLAVDWELSLWSSGVSQLGPLRLDPGGVGVASALLAMALFVVGVVGLLWRAGRIRVGVARPAGIAAELLVLAGAIAVPANALLRGAAAAPLRLQPLGLALSPALIVAVPAALLLMMSATASAITSSRGVDVSLETRTY